MAEPIDHRICFVGDSFVQGTMDEMSLGWVGRLCAAAGTSVTGYNLGVRRDTSLDILQRWEPECECRLPTGIDTASVLFHFGTNDTTIENGRRRVGARQSGQHLQQMLEAAAARGWQAAFVGPPPIDDPEQNERTAALSRQLIDVARHCGVPALHVFDTLASDEVWMKQVRRHDGAHPGAQGYDHMASLVQQWDGWWFP